MAGWPVWLALGIGASGALATARLRFPRDSVQLRIRIILPLLMLGYCIATRLIDAKSWLGLFYKCYYAQLDVAFVVSFAFGAAFALDAIRERHWFSRACGVLYLAAYVWLLTEAFHYTQRMHRWWE